MNLLRAEQGLLRALSEVGMAERAARKTADPEWMTTALKITDIDNETGDALDLQGKPEGDEAVAFRVLFLKKIEKAYGPPRKQIPIEVYYELEDANYHTANEMLDKAGYFDVPYGEREDQYKKDREGIKPLWDR